MTDALNLRDVHEAVNALRAEVESKSVDQAKVAKIESFLDRYENENAKVTAALKAEEQKRLDMEAMFKDTIASLGSARGGNGDERQGEEYKTFMAYMGQGTVEKKNLLRTDSDVAGGYLLPRVMEQEILKNITEFSPMRQFARVMTTSAKTTDIPRRLNNLVAAYEGEAVSGTTDSQEYGTETITVHRLTLTVPATQDMLLGSAFNMEREIVADVSEAFAKAEGTNFVEGSGVKSPLGFTTDGRVGTVDTATSGTLALDDLINVSGELKRGYQPMYFMNRRTLAYLRRQKASVTGDYLWSPAVQDGAPATFNGYAYSADFIDMDSYDAGVGALPVAFGDFRQGYRIYDRVGTTVIRDDYSRKKEAVVEWTFYRYNDGRVVKPEAIKLLKIKA